MLDNSDFISWYPTTGYSGRSLLTVGAKSKDRYCVQNNYSSHPPCFQIDQQ